MGARSPLPKYDMMDTLQSRLQAHHPAAVERPDLRPAGVLVPLFAGPQVLLTRRPQKMSRHPGQIAFPGGTYDPRDGSLEQTALRESHEEIGLDPARVEILGRLDQVWTPTGFVMHPFVGWVREPGSWRAAPDEVEEILCVPIGDLMLPGVFREEQWERGGVAYRVVFFDLPGGTVWGATGRILLRLLQVGFGWTEVAELPWESGPAP